MATATSSNGALWNLGTTLQTLSNNQNSTYGLIFPQPFNNEPSTSPLSMNVLTTLFQASTFAGGVVDQIYLSSNLQQIINNLEGSNTSNVPALPPLSTLTPFLPFVLDHQYRVMAEQQKNISTLASILGQQQQAMADFERNQLRQDTLIARHELLLASSNAGNTKR